MSRTARNPPRRLVWRIPAHRPVRRRIPRGYRAVPGPCRSPGPGSRSGKHPLPWLRARRQGKPRELAVVDMNDATCARCDQWMNVRRPRRRAHSALRRADGLEFAPGSPVRKGRKRGGCSVPPVRLPANLQGGAGQSRGAWRRSSGASGAQRRTARTSSASRAGPIPRPTGCDPSVRIQVAESPKCAATEVIRSAR